MLRAPEPPHVEEENLSDDSGVEDNSDTEEEEGGSPRFPYRVLTYCYYCQQGVRIVLVSTSPGIRHINRLLTESVSIVCPLCASSRGYYGSR
ncbi:putative E7 protein [Equus caballus papillomavirus 7]|uniref:Protein E7 n=1 Tax=Equus caballus papillomavirus 7 TaxID=1235430 RepID=M4HWY8_9PAPI|nr:putative E7 protein [Equus caballus papillomavirus 7]AFU07690.1 putative E7 protein [Equus caballus papillomavirus 7]UJP31700.1 E7 protein [Equus caballus papillomavirus 7]